MPIPDTAALGDSGHIQDHNDISGVLTDHQSRIVSLETDVNSLPESSAIATTSYVNAQITGQLSSYLPLSGGILSGNLAGTTASFSGNVSVSNPTQNGHAATKLYVDNVTAGLSQPQQATFDRMTDGTNTAIADSPTDTFKLRSQNGITITVSSDDPTHGDNALFSLSSIPNSALANNSITVTPGNGLTGGGSISLGGSTTLSLSNSFTVTGNITAATPTASSHLATKGYVDSFFSSSVYATSVIRATWTGTPIPSSVEGAGVGIITVTFPVGRFTQPPSVVTQNIDDGSSSRMVYAKFIPYSISSSSVSMQVVNNAPPSTVSGGGTLSKAIVDIHAIQMTSGSAYG